MQKDYSGCKWTATGQIECNQVEHFVDIIEDRMCSMVKAGPWGNKKMKEVNKLCASVCAQNKYDYYANVTTNAGDRFIFNTCKCCDDPKRNNTTNTTTNNTTKK